MDIVLNHMYHDILYMTEYHKMRVTGVLRTLWLFPLTQSRAHRQPGSVYDNLRKTQLTWVDRKNTSVLAGLF